MSIKVMELDQKRCDAILNAALREFTLRGFDDASTNRIAKEAGMSKALMFHYVNSKQDLFLFVLEYFTELLDKEYFTKLDFSEKDIFNRLRQSYLLQLELIKKYPWIFELNKLSAVTKSEEINKVLEVSVNEKQTLCEHQMFDKIDTSKFRAGLNIEKCKQFILWSNMGFTSQILEDIRNTRDSNLDEVHIIATIDGYFDELKKIFYK